MIFSIDFYKLKDKLKAIIPLMIIPWLLVALFVIHDGEEVLYLPKWVEKNNKLFDNLENRLPQMQRLLRLLRNNNQRQFTISVLVILLILCLIAWSAATFPSIVWIQNIFIGGTVIFTVHLIGHVLQSIYIKKIVPGAITSVIVFPASIYLWLHMLDVTKMTLGYSLFMAIIGAVLFCPLFPLILKFGHWAGQTRKIQV